MPRRNSKKNNTPNGALFSPEFKEVISRLKRREPELDEVVKRDRGKQRKKQRTTAKTNQGEEMNQDETKTPELLTAREVARELKVKQNQVYEYIKRGNLPASRLPGSKLLRITRADLNRYIAEGFTG
jgi:excisionase family DNA binding protein